MDALLGSTAPPAASNLGPTAPDQPSDHVTTHTVSAAHEPPLPVTGTPLEALSEGDACTAAEQLRAASASQQLLRSQRSLASLQLARPAHPLKLLLLPPRENVFATVDNVLDPGRAPQEVREEHVHIMRGLVLHHSTTVWEHHT